MLKERIAYKHYTTGIQTECKQYTNITQQYTTAVLGKVTQVWFLDMSIWDQLLNVLKTPIYAKIEECKC